VGGVAGVDQVNFNAAPIDLVARVWQIMATDRGPGHALSKSAGAIFVGVVTSIG